MKRRGAIVALAALGLASLLARAQTAAKIARVGYLGPSADTAPHLLDAFREGLAALGYVEGRTIAIEYRWTTAGTGMTSEKELAANARDLVDRGVAVMAVSIDPAILAAHSVARGVPIVMMNVSDPIELGLVKSLAHPGGNITGLTRLSPELIGKNLQVLLEVVPQAKRPGLLVSSSNATGKAIVRKATAAATSRGLPLQVEAIRAAGELDEAFAKLARDRVDALLVADTGGGVFFTQRIHLAQLALAQRLPTIVANTENVEAGALMSYSPSSVDNYRRAATFIDRILRGAKAGDIPIEQPTRFELVVNMKTAHALGVAIPQSLLLRADRVIE
jgi:putative ABC transport system substrate-binding protein